MTAIPSCLQYPWAEHAQVVLTPDDARKLAPVAGRALVIAATGGGVFGARVDAAPGTYVSDGGTTPGRIIAYADGSSAWVREEQILTNPAWFGLENSISSMEAIEPQDGTTFLLTGEFGGFYQAFTGAEPGTYTTDTSSPPRVVAWTGEEGLEGSAAWVRVTREEYLPIDLGSITDLAPTSRLQLRRGTTVQHDTFTGAAGELTVDTTLQALRLHDGATEGGIIQGVKVVADKAEAVTVQPQAGMLLGVASADGTIYRAVTGAAAGTYSDDGGDYCRSVIVPTGGDGSSAWVANVPYALVRTTGEPELARAVNLARIQAAINYATVSNIVDNARPCSALLPHGTYEIADEIEITGAVAVVGEGAPMAISGVRIIQTTRDKSVFVVRNATNAAVYFDRIMLKDASGVGNYTTGLFKAESAVTSGNSFYFRDCWFSTPAGYAINIDCQSDDLQIHGCTFDVTSKKFIKLGSATKALTNISIQGNTFYSGTDGDGCIDAYQVLGGVISGNRFYTSGYTVPYAVSFPNALSNNIELYGNTCLGLDTFVTTQSSYLGISCNTVNDSIVPIAIGGGTGVTRLRIVNNTLNGASGAFGIIDCTDTQLAYSVITGNVIEGNDDSASALNLLPAYYRDNIITDNLVSGCTVNNCGEGVWTPTLGGSSSNGTITYTTQVGQWVMTNRQVTLTFTITVDTVSVPASGDLIIRGIPFSGGSIASYGFIQLNTVNYPIGGYTQTGLQIAVSGTYLRALASGDNLGLNVLNSALLAAGDSIVGQITYSLN